MIGIKLSYDFEGKVLNLSIVDMDLPFCVFKRSGLFARLLKGRDFAQIQCIQTILMDYQKYV
jgi:hypothetical protein